MPKFLGLSVSGVAALLGSVVLLRALLRKRSDRAEAARLKRITDTRSERARQEILQVLKQLGEPSQRAIEYSFSQLREALKSGVVKPSEILQQFRGAASRSHSRVHCLTGFCQLPTDLQEIDEAAKTGKPVGKLHGIPFSVKETLGMKGYDCTGGLARRCDVILEQGAEAVESLVREGAIPFCRTNIPQTNLSYGCSNPVFGKTLNPFDPSRTSGGSSGGEAALIATGGSIFGIGSDIGGSVRVPAAFCGIPSFKPTSSRTSVRGMFSVLAGQSGVAGCCGILGKDMDSVTAATEVITTSKCNNDALMASIPWDVEQLTSRRKLKIGYYVADGFLPSTPACARAVREAAERLRAEGHIVIPFKPPDSITGLKLFFSLLTADGGIKVQSYLKDEQLDESLKAFVQGLENNRSWWRYQYDLWKLNAKGFKRLAALKSWTKQRTVADLWNLQGERRKYQHEWHDAIQNQGLDAFLCPAHAMVAPDPKVVAYSGSTLCYTQIFNVLDFPAGTVPVSSVTVEDEVAMQDWPMNVLRDQFGDRVEDLIASDEIFGRQDDILETVIRNTMRDSSGLPLSVQVVGLPWKDEVCLQIMHELERLSQSFTTSAPK